MGLSLFCITSLPDWLLGKYRLLYLQIRFVLCASSLYIMFTTCSHIFCCIQTHTHITYTYRGGMFPGCCHFYALFYFGFSEISTAILCLLANFDPDFGVVGLDKIFPKTKIVLGALFVTSFIVCRLILWPYTTYYFWRDTTKAIRSDHPRVEGRRGFLYLLCTCCAVLSAIQFVFVAMIVKTGREELDKLLNPESA